MLEAEMTPEQLNRTPLTEGHAMTRVRSQFDRNIDPDHLDTAWFKMAGSREAAGDWLLEQHDQARTHLEDGASGPFHAERDPIGAVACYAITAMHLEAMHGTSVQTLMAEAAQRKNGRKNS